MKPMKPTDRRGAWKAESALARVRRCLALLRAGNLIAAHEQARIAKRIHKWKVKGRLPVVVVRKDPSNPAPPMRNTIEERFRAFHAANPQVYQYIIKLTKAQYMRGKERFGLKALWEQIRWHIALGEIRIRGDYMLNNDFTSRYVRMLVAEHPAYRGLFETRMLKSP
jgi:hypothetical protein